MPFNTPQVPWIDIDLKKGRIACGRCGARCTFRKRTLEHLMTKLPPFVKQHKRCPIPQAKASMPLPQKEVA